MTNKLDPFGAHAGGLLKPDGTVFRGDGFFPPVQHITAHILPADAQGGGVLYHDFRQFIRVLRQADDRQQDAGAALLHADGLGIDVPGAGGEELLHGKGDIFAGHVVQVALKAGNVFPFSFTFSQEGADAVGLIKILFAHAVADGFHCHNRAAAETGDKVLQQGSAGGRAELTPDFPAVGGNALQDQRGGRGGNGQDAVGTMYMAAPPPRPGCPLRGNGSR